MKGRFLKYRHLNLKNILLFLQGILILLSIIAIVLIFVDAFKLPIEISSNGYQYFLSLFTPYSILFSATFIVLASNFAIQRLGLMSQANFKSFMASNRTIWIQTVRELLNDIRDDEPYMYKELSKQLLSIHDYLFEKKYKFFRRGGFI